MRKLFFTLLTLLAVAVPALAQEVSPVDFIRDNSKQVLDILKKDDGRNTKEVRKQVEALVLPKFDFIRMTALAVGKNWRSATSEQQEQLATQFQTLLIRVYASTMTRYKNAQIDVKPNAIISDNGKEATVHSEVILPNASSSQKPVSVDYALYKTNQEWRIYNVSVEGASLVTAYRNTFNTEISKNGIDGLIKSLSDKNTKPMGQSTGG